MLTFSRSRGYSLVEMMVVIAVIGIVLSISMFSAGAFDSNKAEKWIERLRLDVQLLSNESIVRSEVLGLGFYEQGYVFMRFTDDDSWEVIEQDRFLKAREFTEKMAARMIIGEDELSLAKSVDEPQIISLPTGEVTPFAYQLDSPTENFSGSLQFDALGRVVVPEVDEAAEQNGALNVQAATAS